MRRFKQSLTDKECVDILCSTTSGVMSLCGTDMIPYGVPLSHVFHEGKLYFHAALAGHKLDVIKENGNASFTVIAKDEVHPETYTTYFRSVIAFGNVRIIDDPNEKRRIIKILGQRCNPDDSEGLEEEIRRGLSRCVAIEMSINRLTGKQAIELVPRT